jgi:hypothetical protein
MKAPAGVQRLKLRCDEPVRDFTFNFNLRRYEMAKLNPRLAAAAGLAVDATSGTAPYDNGVTTVASAAPSAAPQMMTRPDGDVELDGVGPGKI